MNRVLIAYFSSTGKTEKMAEYIAEEVRFSGQEAVFKKIGEHYRCNICRNEVTVTKAGGGILVC